MKRVTGYVLKVCQHLRRQETTESIHTGQPVVPQVHEVLGRALQLRHSLAHRVYDVVLLQHPLAASADEIRIAPDWTVGGIVCQRPQDFLVVVPLSVAPDRGEPNYLQSLRAVDHAGENHAKHDIWMVVVWLSPVVLDPTSDTVILPMDIGEAHFSEDGVVGPWLFIPRLSLEEDLVTLVDPVGKSLVHALSGFERNHMPSSRR